MDNDQLDHLRCCSEQCITTRILRVNVGYSCLLLCCTLVRTALARNAHEKTTHSCKFVLHVWCTFALVAASCTVCSIRRHACQCHWIIQPLVGNVAHKRYYGFIGGVRTLVSFALVLYLDTIDYCHNCHSRLIFVSHLRPLQKCAAFSETLSK